MRRFVGGSRCWPESCRVHRLRICLTFRSCAEACLMDREHTWNREGFCVGAQGAYGFPPIRNFNGATKDMLAQPLALTTTEQVLGVSNWPVIGGTGYLIRAVPSALSVVITGNGMISFLALMQVTCTVISALVLPVRWRGRPHQTVFASRLMYNSAASINFPDVLTLRGRVGCVWNGFLPYAFGGVALGLADTNRSIVMRTTNWYVCRHHGASTVSRLRHN